SMSATVIPTASFFFSSRRRHTRFDCDWSSDVCSSDLDRGRHAWHCTCADAVYKAEEQGRVCKHVQGLLEFGAALPRPQFMRRSRSEERRVGKECRSGWPLEQ